MELKGDALFDCTGAPLHKGAVSVEIAGALLGDVRRSPGRESGEVIDLRGLTILPGLIDLHSHLGVISWQPHEGYSAALLAASMFDNARRCLLSGHTTVRETGGADDGLVEVIRRGLVAGPRVLPSGRAIAQTSGHGDMRPPWWPCASDVGLPGLGQLSVTADGVPEVRKAARENFRSGATQLKVCISGGILSHYDSLTDVQFSLEELSAVVEEAQARGTYVTGHAVNSASIDLGLHAGMTCFEHAFFLSEETATRVREADASIVFTLGVLDRLARHGTKWGISDDRVALVAEVRDASIESLRVAVEAGVRIGSGTDLIGPEQEQRGGEIALHAQVMGAAGAIEAATRVNAEIIGYADRIGTLEPGKRADVIAVRGNPLEDIDLLSDPDNVVFVMRDGAVVKDTRES